MIRPGIRANGTRSQDSGNRLLEEKIPRFRLSGDFLFNCHCELWFLAVVDKFYIELFDGWFRSILTMV